MAEIEITQDDRFDLEKYPVVDLSSYLNGEKKAFEDCKIVADLLYKFGFLCVKDPRVNHTYNDIFIDMMEKYYNQSDEIKAKDIRKEVAYQVGVTPARTERARNHCNFIAELDDTEKPVTICPPDLDNKLRFFWRMGKTPSHTDFSQLHADPVIPDGFTDWQTVMDTWGTLLLATVTTIAEMYAQGLDLPINTFTSLMEYGPHLLAPTGTDLARFGKLGTVMASFHSDLGFLTIHGRSRFPGLFVWTREGKKLAVKVPHGCLLLQAGKQFEWLTGGQVLAGYHEVVVTEKTVEAINKASQSGHSLWRVSSTMFTHIANDETLQPLGPFATPETIKIYPSIKAGAQVLAELTAVNIAKTVGSDGDFVLNK